MYSCEEPRTCHTLLSLQRRNLNAQNEEPAGISFSAAASEASRACVMAAPNLGKLFVPVVHRDDSQLELSYRVFQNMPLPRNAR